MNTDQLGGIVRAVVTALVGFAAGKGWVAAGDTAGIITAVVTLAVAAWSFHTNKAA